MNLQDDRIYDFIEACWNAGIKNPSHFLISKRPQVYDWLKGIFPRGILPTDVDGEVEINGYFLRLEFKDESAIRNGRIPTGQARAFKALISTKRFTVMLIGTNMTGEPTCVEVWHRNGKVDKLEDCNRDGLRSKIKSWSDWAELKGQR